MDENNSICVSTQFDRYGEDDFRKVTIELVLNDEASKAVHTWMAEGCKGALCITEEGCTYVPELHAEGAYLKDDNGVVLLGRLDDEKEYVVPFEQVKKRIKEMDCFREMVEKERAPLVVMTQEEYDKREAELKKLREKCSIGPDRKVHYPDGTSEPYIPDTNTGHFPEDQVKMRDPYTHITCSDTTCDQVKK